MAEVVETLNYPSEWLKWEEDGWYSREDVTILAGSGSARVLTSGMVLAKVSASGKWVQLDQDGSGGAEVAAGILLFDTTAPASVDKRAAIIARDAIVSDNGITWPSTIDSGEIATATAQLQALGIRVREGA
jgi:hypothetical protein